MKRRYTRLNTDCINTFGIQPSSAIISKGTICKTHLHSILTQSISFTHFEMLTFYKEKVTTSSERPHFILRNISQKSLICFLECWCVPQGFSSGKELLEMRMKSTQRMLMEFHNRNVYDITLYSYLDNSGHQAQADIHNSIYNRCP